MIFNLFKAMPPRASAFASMKRPVQVRFMATVRQRAAMEPATFTIRDGPMFSGKSFGARSNISGEAVFTTSLVGYPESLTDPSYRGQILVFTQPLIGNYGVPSAEKDTNGLLKYFESPNLQAAVLLLPMSPSNTVTGPLFRAWASGVPVKVSLPSLVSILVLLSPICVSKALLWPVLLSARSMMPTRMRLSLTLSKSTWCARSALSSLSMLLLLILTPTLLSSTVV